MKTGCPPCGISIPDGDCSDFLEELLGPRCATTGTTQALHMRDLPIVALGTAFIIGTGKSGLVLPLSA